MDRLRRHPDTAAIALLVAITFGAVGFRWYYDNWLTDFDILTFFLPNWTYLGNRLQDFDVPGWNPYFSSGTPYAGDPSGGWMYLPGMATFALLNTVPAIKVMVLVQALIGGVSTYFFSRRIGLGAIAALVAAISLAIGPTLYGATYFTTVGAQVTAFIPLGLLCVESAIRSDRLSARLGWSAGAGVAISQMFASWPGQGLMYGVMIVGGWMGWRWLIEPIPEIGTWKARLARIAEVGIYVSVISAAFGAAGILPRLDFNSLSNIPGGDYSNVVGGGYSERTYPLVRTLQAMVQDGYIYRPYGYGAAVILLAIFAVVMARRRYGVLFFALITFVFLDLTSSTSVTLPVLSLIPGFDHIHSHRPVAPLWVMSIAPSMLAGAGTQVLLEGRRRRWSVATRLAPLAVFLLLCWYVDHSGYPVERTPYIVAALTTIFLLVPWLQIPRRMDRFESRRPVVIAAGLLFLILAYPTLTDVARTIDDPLSGEGFVRTLGKDDPTQASIDVILGLRNPDSAAAFLLSQQTVTDPFRYVAYSGIGYESWESYSLRRLDPRVVAVLANGRSAFLELEQVAGYNPMHLKYYAEYVTAMNGTEQDYHWLDVFASAIIASQLMDMLNVRYILLDAAIPPDRSDRVQIAALMPVVYQGAQVIVFENPFAYSRAWVVHDVRQNSGTEALDYIGGNFVDGRFTAYVNGELPNTSIGDGSVADSALIVSRAPESMTLTVSSNGDGLLVLSEVYEHNWNAWVDGKEVDILRTNHALRGIPVPNGTHTVVLTYQPKSLTIGLWVTGFGTISLIGIWTWALIDRRRKYPL